MQYDQLKPLVARVGWIKKEKDEAKTMDVRKSSLADAEEALWLSVEQQIEKVYLYSSYVGNMCVGERERDRERETEGAREQGRYTQAHAHAPERERYVAGISIF